MSWRNLLPETDRPVITVLSGGMDSTILTRLCVEKYGADKVSALSFFYGQRQVREVELASRTCAQLGIKHKLIDIGFLQEIGKGVSANLDRDIKMPTVKEVLGHPQPVTYVPNRNMILMSIAAAVAETSQASHVFLGLQIHDEYGYHDTTARFVNKINQVLDENRKNKIRIEAPFNNMSKTEELRILLEVDGNVSLLVNTLTCYDPDEEGKSCGVCPSCSERLRAFRNIGIKDPIPYK